MYVHMNILISTQSVTVITRRRSNRSVPIFLSLSSKMRSSRSFLLCLCLSSLLQLAVAQCPQPNGYFADSSQCDAYTECVEGAAEQKLCPDGLLFNDQLTEYPRYPCGYPGEVQCGSRSRTQPAQSTGECPHQYGLFKSKSQGECGTYINCVAGVATTSNCPEGLAFNSETVRCDWPDLVADCDAKRFVKFQCPGVKSEADLGHPRYSDPQDCRKFYVCVDGTKARALSCSVGSVFNQESGVCDEPQNVPNCASYYPKDILDAIEKLRAYENKL